ncbi:glycoside hydrolase family 3 C-terminal domain-containing protein [Anaerocolumna sp. AGMB13025]|uniref:glycoside hydrolase family 3 protein n=1 Tax=Anaerocolumna sp. AGMB13025 TaxID=3039116 RepID=UPI0024204266|nr:glycoside hydrolase family 3 protein [Anaerocolumna sp. AGMB13025]WFR55733.1 glycoside hydrolase family 3 C-terminal domain-containing protein [Anaerocolumna sp. AGMB13025]
MGKYSIDMEHYKRLAREVAAEGCVLIKNDKQTLPVRKNDKVAVFGRIAFHYYKSGLGSGGLVNTRYTVGILEAFKEHADITLNQELLSVYQDWMEKNPYDEGTGWGKVPWSQKEMPLEDSVVERASKESDLALIIIGRTAGEDQDMKNEPGSYLLTDLEKEMIKKVTKAFDRAAVILNVGNIVDMSWVEEYKPTAVLYAWQGGQEGGHGILDVITGKVNPCGKLTDTIAKDIKDYPSTENFGDLVRNYYKEDIYVGYRYFETFAKDSVLYPFGFGLSYTTFEHQSSIQKVEKDKLVIEAVVRNTGAIAGKEVVQVYAEAPQGKLGKPLRVLAGFVKTEVIEAGQEQIVTIEIPKTQFASYDDSGVTGNKASFVLEAGTYYFYTGADVRSAKATGSYEEVTTVVVEKLEEACAPTESFERLKPVLTETGTLAAGSEPVPLRSLSPYSRMQEENLEEYIYTGDKGYKLGDVVDGKVTLNEFIAQLRDEDLIHLFRGEGMSSPKATPGTAGAFGGVSENLKAFGIPVACCADGPSGIRMDCGTHAFSLPNGTLLGCTFNLPLVQELFVMLGLELRRNKIDTLLGPGLNIHRNPLNGRNFEYISEDPLVTGKMGAVQAAGMGYAGVTGTIKHFAANNQESGRHTSDSVVSERALREIYLKGFEITVKEGGAYSVMTSYGAVNGIWSSGNYDLCTTILRKQWGYAGIVMTDWWAKANTEGEAPAKENKAPMVAAQNDLYMCVADSVSNPENDNVMTKLVEGVITRSQLHRNAANILKFIMRSPIMLHKLNRIPQEELEEMRSTDDNEFIAADMVFFEQDGDDITIDGSYLDVKKGKTQVFGLIFHKMGRYDISIFAKSDLGSLAQLPVSVYYDNALSTVITFQGTEGEWVTEKRPLGFVFGLNHYMKLYFGANGLEIDSIKITFIEEIKMPF